jgi:uncharacterized membrane protein YbhN (UPF0104 family)
MEQRKSNISIYGWRLFKLLIAAIAFWFVYQKISSQKDIEGYFQQLKEAFGQPNTMILLVLVLILMFFNWLTEALKWKLMIDRIEKISLFRSLEAVCSGLTISIFTPNRIGEYAGRVFHLEKANKIQATLITVIENISQLLATLLIGSIASIYYFSVYAELSFSLSFLFIAILLSVSFISLLGFFNIRFLENALMRIKYLRKWQSTFHVLSEYTTAELFRVFSLAVLRYFIFVLQFYLLIRMYGGAIAFVPAVIMIAMTYLVLTIIPSMALVEFGIRGAAAAYFFSAITIDILPVLNAVFSLWLINLAIPALAGAVFMLNFRIGKTKPE